MTGFADTFGVAAWPWLASARGETVTYKSTATRDDAEVSESVTAIRKKSTDVAGGTRQLTQALEWRVLGSDLTNTPKRRDTITDASGVVWTIVDVTEPGHGVFVLTAQHQHTRA